MCCFCGIFNEILCFSVLKIITFSLYVHFLFVGDQLVLKEVWWSTFSDQKVHTWGCSKLDAVISIKLDLSLFSGKYHNPSDIYQPCRNMIYKCLQFNSVKRDLKNTYSSLFKIMLRPTDIVLQQQFQWRSCDVATIGAGLSRRVTKFAQWKSF